MRGLLDRITAGQRLYLPSAFGGIRTPNLLIRSQMLYPLSYERVCSDGSVPKRRPALSRVPDGQPGWWHLYRGEAGI